MAKIQIKSEKITPFGGTFPIMDEFDRVLSGIVDSAFGFRCKLFGYQYSEINNGFGWSHLPKSFMSQNAAFLLLTALIYNFYKYILSKLKGSDFGLKPTSRIKTFVFKFVSVAAKWIKAERLEHIHQQPCLCQFGFRKIP